jgi:transcriptional regulator with XRE-family HTH domain
MQHKKSGSSPDELGKKLGSAIAKRRKELGLTQDDLAGLVEVDAETISRMERGTTLPSLNRLFVIAQALETDAGELLSHASPIASDRMRVLADILETLDPLDQEVVLELAKLLQGKRR